MSCFDISEEKLKEKMPQIMSILDYMKGPEFQKFAEKMMEHPSTRVDYLKLMSR
jgi:hypothetical protein